MAKSAKEMRSRATVSGIYNNALDIIMEYVNPADADDTIRRAWGCGSDKN